MNKNANELIIQKKNKLTLTIVTQ